jgi:hypothetical protein
MFEIDTTEFGNPTNTCRNGVLDGARRWSAPAYSIPTVGAQLYTNATLTTAWNPTLSGAGWFLFANASVTIYWAVQVNSNGLILDVVACSSIPSESPTPSLTRTPTPSLTRTPTPSLTRTPSPSLTRTPSITPSPSMPLGECWSISNPYDQYLCVSYVFRDGTSTFTNLGPYEAGTICIKASTGTQILGTLVGASPGSCAGTGTDIVIKTYQGTSCVDATSCLVPTPTPSRTPTPSPTPCPAASCTEWFINNPTLGTSTVDFVNCSGIADNIPIAEDSSYTICVLDGFTPSSPDYPGFLTIDNTGIPCGGGGGG